MSATKDLKNSMEFMQLHTSRHNCRQVQKAVKKSLQVFKVRLAVKPVALPIFAGVPLKDWLLAAKARRELHEKQSRHEQQVKKIEAHKKQAAEAQQRKINNQQWMG
jgi:hypothetical protein